MSERKGSALNPGPEGHTVKEFDGELRRLHRRMVDMGGLALNQVKDAVRALQRKDLALAHSIAERESELDLLEVETDRDILRLIARRSPLGGDLRMVMAVSKGVIDLERVGDEAARIAHLTAQIFGHDGADPNGHILRDVTVMGNLVVTMLEQALQAFDALNDEAAVEILAQRKHLEEEFQGALRRLITYVMEDTRNIGIAINVILAIKALERIGAHAQNLAEYVIFQIRGKDVRHQSP